MNKNQQILSVKQLIEMVGYRAYGLHVTGTARSGSRYLTMAIRHQRTDLPVYHEPSAVMDMMGEGTPHAIGKGRVEVSWLAAPRLVDMSSPLGYSGRDLGVVRLVREPSASIVSIARRNFLCLESPYGRFAAKFIPDGVMPEKWGLNKLPSMRDATQQDHFIAAVEYYLQWHHLIDLIDFRGIPIIRAEDIPNEVFTSTLNRYGLDPFNRSGAYDRLKGKSYFGTLKTFGVADDKIDQLRELAKEWGYED